MVLVRLGVFVILCSAAVGTREAFQNSPSNRPWPPEVQRVSLHFHVESQYQLSSLTAGSST